MDSIKKENLRLDTKNDKIVDISTGKSYDPEVIFEKFFTMSFPYLED